MEGSPELVGDKREELTEILRSRLIECGWRDQVANMCRNLIHKHGVEQIRLEQIVNEVGPKAKQIVPDQVRSELLEMIRKLDQAQLQPSQPQQTEQSKDVSKVEEEKPVNDSIFG